MKQDTKKQSPAADATRRENTTVVSKQPGGMSRKILKAAKDPQAEKLLADVMEAPTNKILVEILKNSLASVTDALKSYANALHKDRHHPLPFVMCQSDECVCGRTIIDGAIGVIARAKEITAEEEPEYEGDPDQLAHDPDLPAPSEVFKEAADDR